MFRPVIVSMAICISGMICCLACGNTELEKAEKRLTASNAENDALRRELSRVQDRYIDLEAKYENLVASRDELKLWSDEVVSALGPSLWIPGTYERPVPIQCFKSATPSQLVQSLNQYFKSTDMPRFELLGIQKRTAAVHIEQETQLTQNMGTTGAQGYLAAVTYTLCSLDVVDCVDFQFAAGSHAFPGPHCR